MIAATRAVDFDFFSSKSSLLPFLPSYLPLGSGVRPIDRSIATPITNLHDGPSLLSAILTSEILPSAANKLSFTVFILIYSS